jgi:hypothetical protein
MTTVNSDLEAFVSEIKRYQAQLAPFSNYDAQTV